MNKLVKCFFFKAQAVSSASLISQCFTHKQRPLCSK